MLLTVLFSCLIASAYASGLEGRQSDGAPAVITSFLKPIGQPVPTFSYGYYSQIYTKVTGGVYAQPSSVPHAALGPSSSPFTVDTSGSKAAQTTDSEAADTDTVNSPNQTTTGRPTGTENTAAVAPSSGVGPMDASRSEMIMTGLVCLVLDLWWLR